MLKKVIFVFAELVATNYTNYHEFIDLPSRGFAKTTLSTVKSVLYKIVIRVYS